MKIRDESDKIIFEFPKWAKRFNPYDEEGDYGEYPYFTGLIVHHRGENHYDEIGFAGTIDMDYKGKPDQVDGFIVMWSGSEEGFREKCRELNIGIQEMTFLECP